MSFKSARVAAGLSVKDVMDNMGVSDAAVYMWETGEHRPKTSRLLGLAALYRCTVEELLRDNPNPKKS